jgi:hypothetical protein
MGILLDLHHYIMFKWHLEIHILGALVSDIRVLRQESGLSLLLRLINQCLVYPTTERPRASNRLETCVINVK